MKKVLLLVILFCSTISISAQKTIEIQINHFLNGEIFENGRNAVNDLDNDFMLDRVEYYLSGFSIVHDGGQVLDVEDSYVLVSLLNKNDPTLIELGTFDVDNVESIHFRLGVDEEANHGDPALWPESHPLAPRFPSMHWGWAAGYRFIALEGLSGPNVDQELQFHCIGNEFYNEFIIPVGSSDDNIFLEIDAEYSNLLSGIDISEGIIRHGNLDEIVDVVDNFTNKLFTMPVNTSVKDNSAIELFVVSPNPSATNGIINIEINTEIEDYTIAIHDALGRSVDLRNTGIIGNISIPQSGLYYISVYDANGGILATRKVIVQ